MEDSFAHYGTNNGIQSGTIAAAGQYSDFHCLLLSIGWITLGHILAPMLLCGLGMVFPQRAQRNTEVSGSECRLHENQAFWWRKEQPSLGCGSLRSPTTELGT